MKRITILFASLLTLLTVSFAAQPAHAVNLFQPCTTVTNANKTDLCKDIKSQNKNDNPVMSTFKKVLTVFGAVLGLIAIIIIIVSGLRMVLSNGNADEFKRSRNAIIYAFVGLIIAILAESIVGFVLHNIS